MDQDKPFTCKFCRNTFSSKSTLKIHLRSNKKCI